ncbi:MAG: universal stress protein [Candidatus Bathyarchaeota archaeon]|jgi:nucleotide-binding universal stress UspA family protein
MFDPLFSKILVAFDGSEPSKRALDYAAKTTAMFQGELIILTVVPPTPFPILTEEGVGAMSARELQDYESRKRESYRLSLETAEAEVRQRYPDLKFEALLVEGRPSSTIVEEAEKRDVCLIIMGSRGLGGITGWILGSTSRKVVDHCTKPILVVK